MFTTYKKSKHVKILEKKTLHAYSKIVPCGGSSKKLVLLRSEDILASAIEYKKAHYIPITVWAKISISKQQLYYDDFYSNMLIEQNTLEKVELYNECELKFFPASDDIDALAVLCNFSEFVEKEKILKKYLKDVCPQDYDKVPEEIEKYCVQDDFYGVYDEHAWWWFETKTNVFHVVAHKNTELPMQAEEMISYTIQGMITNKIKKIIVHEGIETFSTELLHLDDCYDDEEVEELILPDTIQKIGKIKGSIRKMKVPQTVKRILFNDFFVMCGGHWDPIIYSVKQLIIPSTIEFKEVDDKYNFGILSVSEPIEYWEEIVIYGEQKIPDLNLWYETNIFFTDLLIRYPKQWDEGKEGSYADEIIAFIREQQPEKLCFGMAPVKYEAYTEQDYEEIRSRIMPYDTSLHEI